MRKSSTVYLLCPRGLTQVVVPGTVDTSFHPGATINGPIYSCRLQSDQKGGSRRIVHGLPKARQASASLESTKRQSGQDIERGLGLFLWISPIPAAQFATELHQLFAQVDYEVDYRQAGNCCSSRLIHGLRRRKNCGLFVAGMGADLLVPSSVMLALFVTQLTGLASVLACSNAKAAVVN